MAMTMHHIGSENVSVCSSHFEYGIKLHWSFVLFAVIHMHNIFITYLFLFLAEKVVAWHHHVGVSCCCRLQSAEAKGKPTPCNNSCRLLGLSADVTGAVSTTG